MSAEISSPNNNFSKKLFNKNIVLAVLGIIALIALVLYFQYKNQPELPSESPYLVQEDSGTTNQNEEPFSNIDIDGDGDEEQVPREIIESKILMLTDEGELYIINPIDKEKILLLNQVGAYASSYDKNFIAYLKFCSSNEDSSKCDRDLYIYNMKTKNETKIPAGQYAQREIEWSPDGRYVLVDSGTSSTKSFRVYSIESGKYTNCNFGGDPVWISNTETLARMYDKSLPERPGQISDAVGIKKVNIETCKSDSFLPPTETSDYTAIKIDGNDLILEKKYVDNVSDWVESASGSKVKYTFEKYNIQTQQISPYDEYSNIRDAELSRLKSLVPVGVNVRYIYTSNKDVATGWELINVYKGMARFNNEIYLMGPDKTVVKIGEDVLGTWL